MDAIFDRLGLGDRHEAHADGRILFDPDNDLVLPLGQDFPAKRVRPELGQAVQIVSINDDVVESDRHVASMRGTLSRIPHSSAAMRVADAALHAQRAIGARARALPAQWRRGPASASGRFDIRSGLAMHLMFCKCCP